MAQNTEVSRTGVPAIDSAKESLRYLLDHVFEQGVECRRGDGGKGECDHSRCARLDAIIRFASRNFAHQERALAELGYPEAQRYQDDHTALVERLTIMRDSHVCADRDGSKVHDFIAHWTSEHAKRCDPHLSRWASTRRVA